MWGRNWCCLGICALALGLAIFIVAIFPVGFLMFLVALLLVVCGWGCIRRSGFEDRGVEVAQGPVRCAAAAVRNQRRAGIKRSFGA